MVEFPGEGRIYYLSSLLSEGLRCAMQVVPLAKRTRSHKFDRHELHWNGVLGLVWKKLKAIPPKFFGGQRRFTFNARILEYIHYSSHLANEEYGSGRARSHRALMSRGMVQGKSQKL
jgi:hypothetical protein